VTARLDSLRELVAHRDLLYMITWREVKIKYKQSVMGMLWAVLMPLVIVAAGLVVRYAFATLSHTPLKLADLAAVAVKATPWAFFVAAVRFGTGSLVSNSSLVTKIYLPRLIFPLSAVAAQLLDFLVASAVVGALLLLAGVGLSVQLLWLPLLFLGILLLAAGSAILLSAASLFFRDVKYIVEVLLSFAIFFTPVFYDAAMFGRWAPALLVNPISPLLEGISAAAIEHRAPSLGWSLYSFAFAAALRGLSFATVRKLEPFFAESV
jgi:lipopolysaccharide transport system permease protein